MSRYGYYGYHSQPTKQEIQAKANNLVAAARKKGQDWHPVVIPGRAIAKSWWGVAWCDNLERYADYYNRLDRGRRYVRSGAVVDLEIEQGVIHAKVVGSGKKPYQVTIQIDPVPEDRCQALLQRCNSRVENLEKLLTGDFPEDLKDLFQGEGGLFPTPQEIRLGCSCPDWASMCKHVAATLYGVGTRLDEEPALFFTLRGIDVGQFIDVVLADRVEAMLAHAQQPSGRILENADLESLFGVL